MNHTVSKFPARTPDAGQTETLQVNDDSDIIDLGQMLRALWRGKWLILLAVMLGVVAGWYYGNRIADPLYTASTTVVLDPQAESASVSGLSNVVQGLSSDVVTMNTELEVMRSRLLLGQVVDELNLVELPEFNPLLKTPSLQSRLKDWIKESLRGTEAITAADPDPETLRQRAISLLSRKLSIQILPSTRVFSLSVTTEAPVRSTRIIDTLAEAYIGSQLAEKFQAAEDATIWLTNRVSDLQADLETAEARVKAFNASTDLISQEVLIGQERQLKEMRDRSNATEQRLASAQARLVRLRAASTPAEQRDAAEDPTLTQLFDEIGTAQGREAFDARYATLVGGVQQDIARLERQLAPLRNSMQTLESQVQQQSQDLIELQQLTREAEATRLLYEYFLSRLKETSVQQGIQQADSRVLSEAVRPGGPSSPNKQMLQVIGGILGFLLVAGVLLVRELTGETFRTAAQLEAFGGRTVMGQIPLLPQRQRGNIINYLYEHPTSAASEAIRNLRTSLVLANGGEPPQVVALTSCVPGEGKTTVSIALGQNFRGLGKKVLLLEGDIRRRVLSQHLGVDHKDGMMSVVLGDKRFEDVVIQDETTGVDILVSERSELNAADFFASSQFAQFLTGLREHYDVIIIDTPPVLVVPDVRVIAGLSDALLFLVRWDYTKQPQVQEALRLFQSAGQPITGFILNQISERGMKTYGYGGRYGAYTAYGKKYYNEG